MDADRRRARRTAVKPRRARDGAALDRSAPRGGEPHGLRRRAQRGRHAARRGEPRGARLAAGRLGERRRANPTAREVWVQPDAAVEYEQVVRVMDTIYDAWAAEAGRAASHREGLL